MKSNEIKVVIPLDDDFNLYKPVLKRMYEDSKEKIGDDKTFEFITSKTLFYGFIKKDITIGAIYFFKYDGKLYLNAYAGRKHLEDNIECVKMSLKWFNCDIYAEAQNRASALCLLRAGFKRFKDNTFVYLN